MPIYMKSTDVRADDIDEEDEPGEVIESAPPLKLGEEREFATYGLKRKLIKYGSGWDTPEIGDEATVRYVELESGGERREKEEAVTVKLGEGEVAKGLEIGIVSMKKGEVALFTVPAELARRGGGYRGDVAGNEAVRYEVELVRWIRLVDLCRDGGIVKKILEKGKRSEMTPGDLDQVLVKYCVTLVDGTVVTETTEEGVEFYVKDGHFCAALSKSIRTMRRDEKARLIVQPQYAFGDEGRDAKNGFQSIPPGSVLDIDIELVSFKPVIDITGDGKVLKKILKEGESTSTADEGATVTGEYIEVVVE